MAEGRPGLVRKKVTVHRNGKVFQQYRWVREEKAPTKERRKKKEIESEQTPKAGEEKNERPDLNVMIDGKLPTFESIPKNIKIPDTEINKMVKILKKSGKIEREIAAPINITDDGKMSIGKPNTGSENNCLIPAGTNNYAVYHTHPDVGGIKVLDSFSLEDIMLVTTRHRLQRTNIMMAHTVRNGNLWVCVPSAETMNEIDNGMTDIVGTQKFVSDISSEMDTAIMEKNGKRARRAIKKYCDKFKMKLYVGQPGDLKEYDGKW